MHRILLMTALVAVALSFPALGAAQEAGNRPPNV